MIVENEVVVDVVVDDSVMGFLLDNVVLLGLFVPLRVTTVDLTVEVFAIGFAVVTGFMLTVELGLVFFSSESTENVVTSISSAEIVVASTLRI